MRGQVAFASMRGREAPALLLDAARALEVVDPELAHATHLEALSAAMFAGHLAVPGAGVVEVARAARARPHRSGPRRAPDLLLDGLATLFTDGYSSAVPTLRQAQCGFGLDMSEAEQLHWFWLASVSCNLLWDEVRWASLSGRHVRLARATGALAELPLALTMRVYTHLFTGELTTAASLVEELRAVTDATGSHLAPYGAVGLAALCGREAEAVALLSGGRLDATDRGEGVGLAVLNWAEALLHNGLARYAEAYAAAVRVAEHPDVLASSNWWMVELIEAAVRVGTPELAADSHARLQEMADAAGTEWARGIEARSRALLTDGAAAEPMYREAIQRLGRTVLRPDLARAHLLYGEWLRRQRRRLDARAELRLAHKMFTGMGMEAFAERTRVELEATGARARRRVADTIDQLTPQEAQVARRAAHGETNRDIAAQLFISPSTVEYHLRKAFRKLGVRSRTQLAQRVL
jgi:DNA-binding CsgD family transcriptional regulator